MRHLLLPPIAALLFVAAGASPAKAQLVVITGDGSAPGGFYSITTPRYYGGFAVTNGGITTFPTYPAFGYPAVAYPAFGRPALGPCSGYPSYPGRYPFTAGTCPGIRRP